MQRMVKFHVYRLYIKLAKKNKFSYRVPALRSALNLSLNITNTDNFNRNKTPRARSKCSTPACKILRNHSS